MCRKDHGQGERADRRKVSETTATTAADLTDPAYAASLDEADPLAHLQERFVVPDPDLVYLDGNSLGRLPLATRARLGRVVDEEWGRGLVRSWDQWMELPQRVGDLLAEHLLGARPGEVALSDCTTVNLYKLAIAALDARPGRAAIVTDDDNFPTDRYVLEGIAKREGRELRLVHTDLDEGLDLDCLAAALEEQPPVALVSLSHVAYRSGALADMAAVTELAHRAGALVLWDLCHAVGAVPVDLTGAGADLAVGCTYKYLDGGPGAPALLYVRRELQAQLRQPIWGWFGQEDQFEMGPEYRPRVGIERFLTGTPPVPLLAAVEEGAALLAEAGIEALRAKGRALTAYVIALHDAWLAPLGLSLASPRDPGRRGSHVTLRHPQAARIVQEMAARGVVADHRVPERIRLGPSPLSTSFAEVHRGMTVIRRVGEDLQKEHRG
jgi:kynureninase